MKNKIFPVTFLAVICFSSVLSQTSSTKKKHLIYFIDKNNTPYSITEPQAFLSPRSIQRRNKQNILIRQNDLPVTPTYVDSLRNMGADVWYNSRWFNASVIESDSAMLETIKKLSFVKSTKSLNKKIRHSGLQDVQTGLKPISTDSAFYGPSYNQAKMIGAAAMHEDGFRGEGMLIAVLDAGFFRVDSLKAFRHLYQNNLIRGTYDFVARNNMVYDDNTHGMVVFSCMAAYAPNMMIGTAFKAGYILLRTEDVTSEQTIEEANWLIAAEYADSAGADIINSSLGYSTFDDSTQNYNYSNMDGNTALVTKAADMAASKGMLVVSSAGNYGNKPWKYISAPADGDSVLAVGAVSSTQVYAGLSSVGPSYDRRIKPDLSAMGTGVTFWTTSDTISSGGSGTSFASPILCGMAAGLWQAFPNLTAFELLEVLRQSGSHYNYPDSLTGYGIPDYVRARKLLDIRIEESSENFQIKIYPNPFQNLVTLFVDGSIREKIKIRICDSSGREVLKKQVQLIGDKQLIRLNPGKIEPGVYLISIEGRKVRRILKTLKM